MKWDNDYFIDVLLLKPEYENFKKLLFYLENPNKQIQKQINEKDIIAIEKVIEFSPNQFHVKFTLINFEENNKFRKFVEDIIEDDKPIEVIYISETNEVDSDINNEDVFDKHLSLYGTSIELE